MDQIFKLILIYMLFRASFLFFLLFYFYSFFAEGRGGETGNSSSKNRSLSHEGACLTDNLSLFTISCEHYWGPKKQMGAVSFKQASAFGLTKNASFWTFLSKIPCMGIFKKAFFHWEWGGNSYVYKSPPHPSSSSFHGKRSKKKYSKIFSEQKTPKGGIFKGQRRK